LKSRTVVVSNSYAASRVLIGTRNCEAIYENAQFREKQLDMVIISLLSASR